MISLNDPGRLSIRHRLAFLLRDSIIYGGAAAFNKAFSLITFPLLTRYFSVTDYGIIDFFTVLASLLTIVFIFGQDSAVARYFYEYSEIDERRQITSQSLFFQIAIMVIVIPILWFFAEPLIARISNEPMASIWIKIILLQVPFVLLVNFSQNLLKWTFARREFLLVSLGPVVLNVVLLVLAIYLLRVDITGVFVIVLIVQGTAGILGLYFIRSWLCIPKDMKYLRELIPFALPFGVIGCIGAFVPALERSLTNSLLGELDLGLYAAGSKVALLMVFAIQAFQMAWGPFSLAIYREAEVGETYNWVLKGFTLAICVAVLALSAITHPVLSILASEHYAGASVVVFPIAMGLAIQAISWITEIGIGLSKKSYLTLYGYIAYLLVTALAIYGFASLYGLIGVALGVLLGHIVKSIIASWLAQRAYRLPWQFGPVSLVILATVSFGLFGAWLAMAISNSYATFIYLIGICNILLMGWFLLLTVEERKGIRYKIPTHIKSILRLEKSTPRG
ncbi:MAG: oligosaccharide flippase family protein [Caldilineaceae bacterium]